MVWDLKSPAEAGSAQGEQNTAPEPEQMKVINHVRMHHIHSLTEHQPTRTHAHTSCVKIGVGCTCARLFEVW